ncbi:MAG: hypothetical protein ACR2JK_01425 [Geodermatophilaceae bacterium]
MYGGQHHPVGDDRDVDDFDDFDVGAADSAGYDGRADDGYPAAA